MNSLSVCLTELPDDYYFIFPHTNCYMRMRNSLNLFRKFRWPAKESKRICETLLLQWKVERVFLQLQGNLLCQSQLYMAIHQVCVQSCSIMMNMKLFKHAMCWQIWDLGPQGSLYKRWWQTMCKKWHCQSILTWNSMQRLVAVFFETLAHTGRAQTTTLKQKKGTASQQQLHYSILWCFGEELSYADTVNRLWNCDETAFCSSATSTKLLCRRGAKTLHEIGGRSGREYITVHVACSASGACLPPFILYKGKNINNGWRQALLVQCMEISD